MPDDVGLHGGLRGVGPPTPSPHRARYELAIISEIRMILDYVAASPNASLADVKFADPAQPGITLDLGAILQRLEAAEADLQAPDAPALAPSECALLQLARDALLRQAAPASGTTIAFTALVADQLREAGTESRASLAALAYPGLPRLARQQRWMRNALLGLAVVVTLFAGWESAKVALGRSLLQGLEALRTEQAALDLDRNRVEALLDVKAEAPATLAAMAGAEDRVALTAFSLCNRPYALDYYVRRAHPASAIPPDPGAVAARRAAEIAATRDRLELRDVSLPPLEGLKMYSSSAERELCEHDHVLGFKFSIVHADLARYGQDWAGMVGSLFAMTAWFVNLGPRLVCGLMSCANAAAGLGAGAGDIEFMIAPILLVWANYVLPVIFGLLGSLIFVILDMYNKMRASRLHPRDTLLGPIRLILGMVTGACIGLFFSASAPPPLGTAAGLVAGLSLSASGLAFLAGFGVEGVFTMLDGLVRQVFPPGAASTKDR